MYITTADTIIKSENIFEERTGAGIVKVKKNLRSKFKSHIIIYITSTQPHHALNQVNYFGSLPFVFCTSNNIQIYFLYAI